jgi:hypothetical protein
MRIPPAFSENVLTTWIFKRIAIVLRLEPGESLPPSGDSDCLRRHAVESRVGPDQQMKVLRRQDPVEASGCGLLITSSTPGHAIRGTDRARMLGAIVGKALQPLESGTGMFEVRVTLQ